MKIKKFFYKFGFTLMEMIITVAMISILVSFVIPNWTKALYKQNERNVLIQLKSLNLANEVYQAQTREFLPGTFDETTISTLNDNLRTDILLEGREFDYSRTATTAYDAEFRWTDGNTAKKVILTEDELSDTATPPNPCCVTDNCLLIPDC